MNNLIDQYLDWLRIRNCSPRTVRSRREILQRIDRDLTYGIERATADELKEWIFRSDWSQATRQTYYGAARSFFVWACNPHDARLNFDPMALLPRPSTPRGLPRPVSDTQLRRILTTAVDPFRTWALLAAYAGLRCIEIAGLHREHVTEENLHVIRGKGGRPGILPTHSSIWAAVKGLPPGPVAWTKLGTPASEAYISIRTSVYFKDALQMPGVGLHRLRHWYGTMLYRNTKDIRRTQELMRHASPATTAIYTLVSSEERLAAIQTLPNLGPESC
jgi:integrase/recombinase XerC